jgi:O-antigen ligase
MFEIVIVLISNRSKLGKLLIYFGSVLFYIFPFLFKASCVREIKECNYMFLSLFIITIIYGIIQHNFGYFVWELNWGKFSQTKMNLYALSNWGHFTRAFSFFSGVQDFALFIIFVTLLLWTHSKGSGIKLLLLLLLIIGLYISGSKSMMISLAVAFSAYFFRKRIGVNLMFFGIYILPYILILLLYVSLKDVLVFELQDTIGLLNIGTILPRLEIAYTFFSSFDISNIFGVGLGCMDGVVDNMYIRILIETGIIGFLLFMFLVYTSCRQLYYLDKNSTESSQEINSFLFLLLIVMTFSMHSGELLTSRYVMIAFVYTIICINEKYKRTRKMIR